MNEIMQRASGVQWVHVWSVGDEPPFKLRLQSVWFNEGRRQTHRAPVCRAPAHLHHKSHGLLFQSKELQLDIIPANAPGSEVKLRDAAHELNEEKRKSARRKE